MAMAIFYLEMAVVFLTTFTGTNGYYMETTLECHRRAYTFTARQTDDQGRKCWDDITVIGCWGRCDTAEIAHWQFPYKISFHRVCIHDRQRLTKTTLRNCDEGADPSLRIYWYREAISCSCKVCKSENTSCEPYRTLFPNE